MFWTDELKTRNALTVEDAIRADSEITWAQFFGYPNRSINCCVFYPQKGVNFWFPHCDPGGPWTNVLSDDGQTLTETSKHIVRIDTHPNKHYPPRLVFPRFKDANSNTFYFKFVGVFQYSDEDSEDGLIHVYKRISDRLIWKNGNPADFEW